MNDAPATQEESEEPEQTDGLAVIVQEVKRIGAEVDRLGFGEKLDQLFQRVSRLEEQMRHLI